ncbi:GOLPH3/VPS74 family protein [Sphaerimonospora mesophila]|uniref:GOLPH3/VPS74 family protein n=1 Tax=Sphaerimonospora mesophila TaxID=37483 RepID=UPI001365BBF6
MTEADLAGPPLASDLYFVIHDDRTGQMRLHPRLTGLGLAAAVVGELMLAGRVAIAVAAGQARLTPLHPAPAGTSPGAVPSGAAAGTAMRRPAAAPAPGTAFAPGVAHAPGTTREPGAPPVIDGVAQTALGHIVAEPAHSLQTWLHFLARTAHADVAARLTAAGLLRPPSGRRLPRRSRPQVPVDPNVALWPTGRLNLAIQRGQRLDVRDALLLGLVVATTVARTVLWEPESRHLADSIAGLPAPYRELIAQTKAAIGDAVISPR